MGEENKKYRCKYYIHNRPLPEVLPTLYLRMTTEEIAKEYHIPFRTITSWVSKLKLRHDRETVLRINKTRRQEILKKRNSLVKQYYGKTLQEIVSQYYPIMLTRDIAEKFGCSQPMVDMVARNMGVEHNAEIKLLIYLNRLNRGKLYLHQLTDELRKKYAWKLKELCQEEVLHVCSPARMKKKDFLWSRSVLPMRRRLCKIRKYFFDPNGDALTLFYDADTLRKSSSYKRTEEDYTRYYGFIFKPAKGYQEEFDDGGNE